MRLTTKGRFAVTAMVDLAMRQSRGPVTLATLTERLRRLEAERDPEAARTEQLRAIK